MALVEMDFASGGGGVSYSELILVKYGPDYRVYKPDDTTASSSEYVTVVAGSSNYAKVTALKDCDIIIGGISYGAMQDYVKVSLTTGTELLLDGSNGLPLVNLGYSTSAVSILVL